MNNKEADRIINSVTDGSIEDSSAIKGEKYEF